MRNIARLLAFDLRSLRAAPTGAAAILLETALFSMSDILAVIGFLMGAWVVSCTAVADDGAVSAAVCTLPVTRAQIVCARYLFTGASLLALCGIMRLINGAAAPLLPHALNRLGTDAGMAVGFFAGALLASVMLALFYTLGAVCAQRWFLALFCALFLGAALFGRQIAQSGDLWRLPRGMVLVLWAAGLAVLAVSFLVARYAYTRRSLDAGG
ncbi:MULTISPECIES: ABC-2 transporter permease [Anaerotruncus]|jgi:ABC-type transport system involved in multi-copper enzyme maturation permease subunit|uniref:ABC-2 family transporter protein n=1 Tax=Anaerotruncus colihominis TaxID=169435 RepID=A0A845T5J0_9FIRM|nr:MULTISPECIES: ABC-2 transporter permease [Anaerotruncus]MCI8492245.1 hypothetical protein [Anaerotruncus sp.]MCR2025628.1 ABC-2 transporter permease [Anaerotruncus colihominis]NDO39661.1 hypothetical protein [Anaerotruncus colihominis]